jgi:hypothetical protein
MNNKMWVSQFSLNEQQDVGVSVQFISVQFMGVSVQFITGSHVSLIQSDLFRITRKLSTAILVVETTGKKDDNHE